MSRYTNIGFMILVMLVWGCDTNVDPVVDGAPPFSVYGFLNPLADTQAVQVFALEQSIQQNTSDPLDATVQLINESSGEMFTLSDSLVEFDGGLIGHVYWVVYQPGFDTPYRVEITRSDGAQSIVQVRTPERLRLAPPTEFDWQERILSMQIEGPAQPFIGAQLSYATRTIPIDASIATDVNYEVDYTDRVASTQEGLDFDIPLRRDFITILQEYLLQEIQPNDLIQLENMRFEIMIVNPEWDPPGGVFDAEVLAEPGVFSNVENGYGFLGAGYPLSVSWVPADSVLERSGFALCRPGVNC